LPTLDAVVQRSKSESENVTRVSSTFDNTSFGFQLSIPLYAGGGVTSQVRQAIAEQDRAEQALEAGKRDLAIRVQREFRGVTEGILKIRAYEQAVKSAELLVTSSRRSLQAGSRTIIDVLNAEQQRTLAARDLAQSRYLYLLVGDVDLARMSQINGWLGTLQPLAANQVE
jgi:outer membrane protein, protease secretion system